MEIKVATIPKTISLTEKNNAWIKSRVQSGNYGNASEYLRDLIRQDEERENKVAAIRAALIKGENSGLSDQTVAEIVQEVEARLFRRPPSSV